MGILHAISIYHGRPDVACVCMYTHYQLCRRHNNDSAWRLSMDDHYTPMNISNTTITYK